MVDTPLSTPCFPWAAYSLLQSLNLVALIGPYQRAAGLAAEGLHLPYVSLTEVTSESRDYTLALSPDISDIGTAAYDLANNYDWSKISVFYDDDRGTAVTKILPLVFTCSQCSFHLQQVTI